ncbi:gamma-glutamyl-gamma-aminobutyrate hydrolase family protein [bacterium]|nr:gamma-glutamyl-gamma-aminobutyrate hydrolase family protein [bacterium]
MIRRTFLTSTSILAAICLGFFVGQNAKLNPIRDSRPIAEEKFNAPLIGIASLTSDTYVLAVKEAGGVPIVLPNGDGSSDKIAEYLNLLDGLIMPGGADIPPSEWGEEPHPTTQILEENRYLFWGNVEVSLIPFVGGASWAGQGDNASGCNGVFKV